MLVSDKLKFQYINLTWRLTSVVGKNIYIVEKCIFSLLIRIMIF